MTVAKPSGLNCGTMGEIPRDPALEMFSYLPAQALGRCCQVCKNWKKFAEDPKFWNIFLTKLNVDLAKISEHPKTFYGKWVLKSFEQFGSKVKEFANRLTFETNATLTCSFPHNPYYEIQINVGPEPAKRAKKEIEQHYYVNEQLPVVEYPDPPYVHPLVTGLTQCINGHVYEGFDPYWLGYTTSQFAALLLHAGGSASKPDPRNEFNTKNLIRFTTKARLFRKVYPPFTPDFKPILLDPLVSHFRELLGGPLQDKRQSACSYLSTAMSLAAIALASFVAYQYSY